VPPCCGRLQTLNEHWSPSRAKLRMGLHSAACFTGSLKGVVQVSRKGVSQIKEQVAINRQVAS
jgi:hypothetical protein